ncbi:hypothetical protein Y88_2044 [Novosphingobium nitrogenifigens DSM 19370]|uniref:Uncharacterized protein n=1 Tax=Novosphingobium nitrogenifigens DSM 19370 TaxID=983920 RepID=F1Z5R0_9SPHN|nr:hypothetical protein Y88_2044 [Novosphingobium nitrogenifigens DSM 19370]
MIRSVGTAGYLVERHGSSPGSSYLCADETRTGGPGQSKLIE